MSEAAMNDQADMDLWDGSWLPSPSGQPFIHSLPIQPNPLEAAMDDQADVDMSDGPWLSAPLSQPFIHSLPIRQSPPSWSGAAPVESTLVHPTPLRPFPTLPGITASHGTVTIHSVKKHATNEDFARHMPTIVRLYSAEKKTLKQVIEIMEREHQFFAT